MEIRGGWRRRRLEPMAIGALALLGLACSAWAAHDSKPAARVGSHEIAMADVEGRMKVESESLQARYEAQVRRFDVQLAKARTALLERTVEQLVDEKVLDLEATARGTTPEALLAALPAPAVSDAEVRTFYEANAARLGRPLAEAEPQIRSLLAAKAAEPARRAYLDGLRRTHHVRYSYEPARYAVDGGGTARGGAHARVTIVEFADFQCPYCASLAPVIDRVLERYGADVRHVYRHLPLTGIHPQAYGAAVASVCAGEQGRFWEMHPALYADATRLDRESLLAIAARLGLGSDAFTTCLDSDRARAVVDGDVAATRTLPIEGTPSLFVNGRMFLGPLTYEALVRYVEQELDRTAPRALAATER